MSLPGPKNAISVVLPENDHGWTLMETGVTGSADRIKEVVTSLGSGPDDLRRIFFTPRRGERSPVAGRGRAPSWKP